MNKIVSSKGVKSTSRPKTLTDKGYRSRLGSDFHARRARNPLFSARAYARKLGIGKSTLAAVLAGSRHLSLENAEQVAERLAWSARQKKEMLEEINGSDASHFEIQEDVFALIADWYHYAILSLAKLEKNEADSRWIADRLGIKPALAQTALDRLIRLGYLEVTDGKLVRRTGALTTAADVPSDAVKERHRQNIDLASRALASETLERRDFSSITVNLQRRDMRRAKEAIKKFRREFSKKWDNPDATDVFILSIQLFPLTKEDDPE